MIVMILYNLLNLPSMLQFQNGNTTSYQYSNDGVKRKVTHQTAIANVVIPMGSIQPLSTGQIAYTSTTDYCGNVIYEDGILSKILTSEGYITLSGTTSTYHYYFLSPYGYCAGNPIACSDENGEWINFVVGAIVGVATDYAVQVVANVVENGGEITMDAFTNVDRKSIAISAGTGAMGVGIASGISKLTKVAKIAQIEAKSKTTGAIVNTQKDEDNK